jgi:RHS repeat-associated protein
MDMVGRKFGGGVYRYGFNGKENDSEVEGADNFQDYGMRAYDVRVGRFVSVDPLTKKYPWYTPYQFAGNKPIQYIDLDGGEEKLKDKIKNDAAKKNDSKDKNLSPTMDPKSPLYIPPPDMSWLTNTTPAVPKNEGKTSPEKSNSLPVKVGEVGESISNMASLAEVAKIKGAGQLGGAGEGIAIGANTYIFITAPPGSEKKSAAGAQVVVDGVTYIASRAEPVIGEVLLAKDIIVISYEAFRSLPNSPEVQQALLEDAKRRSEKSYAAWKYYQELNRKLTPPHEINPQFVPGNQYNEY